MKLARWITDSLARLRRPAAVAWVTAFNLTRETTVAERVEVADHGARRRKGLLGRTGLPADEGLWIVPCESVHTIGMEFSIDLIYLDRNHKVRKVVRDVPRWRLSACFSAHSVIELAAGSVYPTQTCRGDQLEFLSVPAPSKTEFDSD